MFGLPDKIDGGGDDDREKNDDGDRGTAIKRRGTNAAGRNRRRPPLFIPTPSPPITAVGIGNVLATGYLIYSRHRQRAKSERCGA